MRDDGYEIKINDVWYKADAQGIKPLDEGVF
jgi:hypothetical protein